MDIEKTSKQNDRLCASAKRALKHAINIYSDKDTTNDDPTSVFVIEYINLAGQLDYKPVFRRDLMTAIKMDDLTKLDGHNKKESCKSFYLKTLICLVPIIIYIVYGALFTLPYILQGHILSHNIAIIHVIYVFIAMLLALFPFRKSRIAIVTLIVTLVGMNLLDYITLPLSPLGLYLLVYFYAIFIFILVLFLRWLNSNH